jgi:translation initiation factor 3 subunit M
VDAECLKISEQVAIGAIRDPVSLFEQQRNILSLPAIQALEQTSGPLFALLKVVQEGKLEDYNAFVTSNGGVDVLKRWEDVSSENCVRYMRILSLCSLAAEHEEIPYQVVADTLQTTLDDVESWVIAAVSSGLLSAKMDQLQNKVVVQRCVVRKFDIEQWKAVQTRLHVWKKNVGGILEAYRQSLHQHQQ